MRTLNSVDAHVLPGTEGATASVWSPDAKWLAFFVSGKLKKINPGGGPPQTIAALPGFQDGTWGPGGEILFRTDNREPLSLIRDTGGSVKPVTKLNAALKENSHRYPQFLPDGRHFLFVSRCADRAHNTLYVASLDARDLKRIMPAQAQVRYVPSSNGQTDLLFYYRDGALVAQAFDPPMGI
jgi:Tol biopolymer transport system component